MSQYAEEIQLIKSSELFDREWYLKKYPDVALLLKDPVEHYVMIGARLGRDPGPNFSTQGYLQAHPDVAQARLNPLVHFLKCGRDEGRLAPMSKSAWEDRRPPAAEARRSERSAVVERAAAPLPGPSRQPEPPARADEEQARELEKTKRRCQELEEENELLLLQLHQVQEELEEYFLKYQELVEKGKEP